MINSLILDQIFNIFLITGFFPYPLKIAPLAPFPCHYFFLSLSREILYKALGNITALGDDPRIHHGRKTFREENYREVIEFQGERWRNKTTNSVVQREDSEMSCLLPSATIYLQDNQDVNTNLVVF